MSKSTTQCDTIRRFVPDDLQCGDYITVTRMQFELLPSDCDSFRQDLEPQRIELIPSDAGHPLKVIDVCLPFVLAIDAHGTHRTLDLRRHRLAQLSPRYARAALEKLARRSNGKKSKKRK